MRMLKVGATIALVLIAIALGVSRASKRTPTTESPGGFDSVVAVSDHSVPSLPFPGEIPAAHPRAPARLPVEPRPASEGSTAPSLTDGDPPGADFSVLQATARNDSNCEEVGSRTCDILALDTALVDSDASPETRKLALEQDARMKKNPTEYIRMYEDLRSSDHRESDRTAIVAARRLATLYSITGDRERLKEILSILPEEHLPELAEEAE